MVYANELKVKHHCQEACMKEQRALDKPPVLKGRVQEMEEGSLDPGGL